MSTVSKVLSVNIGTAKEFEYKNRTAKSAIWKSPTSNRLMAQGINLDGDEQADREAHGGVDKAIYAYAIEDIHWWQDKINRSIEYGEFGENLTTQGIDVNNSLVGEQWKVGNAILEVSEPRIPCWRLGVRMNDKTFPREFTRALRAGTYLRIATEGDIGEGDEVTIAYKPDHDLTVREVFRIYTKSHDEAARLLAVSQISDAWKRWANDILAKNKKRSATSSDPGCC